MKHDIVYFVKQAPINEELRYSLRSVEKNFPHRKVWFYGGCPDGITPDEHVKVVQDSPTKWGNVTKMLKAVCNNDAITEEFWLFNDDFFIMQPFEDETPLYNGSVNEQIEMIEKNHGGHSSNYTTQMRRLVRELESKGLPTKNFAVHMPLLVSRKKALEVFEVFPFCPMFRNLYGNYCGFEGKKHDDVKIWELSQVPEDDCDMLSTNDATWEYGEVGEFIRKRFTRKSRFEK